MEETLALSSANVTVTGTVTVPPTLLFSVTVPFAMSTLAPAGAFAPSANVVPSGTDAAAPSAFSVNFGVRFRSVPASPRTVGYSTLRRCACDCATRNVTVVSSLEPSAYVTTTVRVTVAPYCPAAGVKVTAPVDASMTGEASPSSPPSLKANATPSGASASPPSAVNAAATADCVPTTASVAAYETS